MPIYEYRCRKCRKKSQILTLRVSEKPDETCQHCGGGELVRLMSRFAMPKSEEARLDALADPSSLGDLDENDPKAMARFMRKMGKEMGEEFEGDEFEEMVDELEAGGFDDDGDEGAGDGDDSGATPDLDD